MKWYNSPTISGYEWEHELGVREIPYLGERWCRSRQKRRGCISKHAIIDNYSNSPITAAVLERWWY
jgi:hypothetical protein